MTEDFFSTLLAFYGHQSSWQIYQMCDQNAREISLKYAYEVFIFLSNLWKMWA